MKTLRTLKTLKTKKNAILTLGNFDGVHLGHQKILKKITTRAKKLGTSSVVYTFEPHPQKIVAPHKSTELLIDLKDKKALIEALGVDFLVLASFTKDFSTKHPDDFVKDIIVDGIGASEVYIGHDYCFGRGKSGTIEKLKTLSKTHGFKVFVIPAVRQGSEIISSTAIRKLIHKGEVNKASKLLGRNYRIKGTVIGGTKRGKSIGFPTANLDVSSELIPALGVYAATAKIGSKTYKAATNIGTSPTFGASITTVEAHLIDFSGEIYGREVELTFTKRLRDEKKFPNIDSLVTQIKKDIQKTEKILA